MQLRTRLAEYQLKLRNLEGLEQERRMRIELGDARLQKLLPDLDQISVDELRLRIRQIYGLEDESEPTALRRSPAKRKGKGS